MLLNHWRITGYSVVAAGPHPLAKYFWEKLIRFGQIWVKFGQNWGEIWVKLTKFGWNMDKIEAKFGQIWLDLGKLKILQPKNIRSPTAMTEYVIFTGRRWIEPDIFRTSIVSLRPISKRVPAPEKRERDYYHWTQNGHPYNVNDVNNVGNEITSVEAGKKAHDVEFINLFEWHWKKREIVKGDSKSECSDVIKQNLKQQNLSMIFFLRKTGRINLPKE